MGSAIPSELKELVIRLRLSNSMVSKFKLCTNKSAEMMLWEEITKAVNEKLNYLYAEEKIQRWFKVWKNSYKAGTSSIEIRKIFNEVLGEIGKDYTPDEFFNILEDWQVESCDYEVIYKDEDSSIVSIYDTFEKWKKDHLNGTGPYMTRVEFIKACEGLFNEIKKR